MVEHTTEPMPGPRRADARRRSRRRRAAARRGGDAGRRARAGRPAAARRRPRPAGRGGRDRARRARAPARRDRLDRRRDRAGEHAALAPGQVRDACAPALAGLVREAGGEPVLRGIVPDDAAELERVLGESVAEDDVVVVSAGSSVGARDLTATVVGRLGEIVCHGLAIKPGKPTLLADCGGVPLIGLPGNPRSALVVFRLVGVPLVRTVAGITAPPPAATVRATLARDVPSAAGRLDVVQATVRDGVATPRFGSSALLGPMVARRRLLPRAGGRHGARRGHRGRRRALRLSMARRAPFLSDIPAAEALATWLAAVPERLEAVELELADALGRVTAAPDLGAALLARLRRSRDGRHRGARRGHVRRDRDRPAHDRARSPSSTPATRCPEGCDAVVMREQVHWRGRRARGPGRRGSVAARAHDRRGRQRDRAAAARGPPAAPRRPGRRRRRRPHDARRSGARRTSS